MRIFVLFLVFSLNALAGKTDNQVQFKIDNKSISITTKKGFHLNVEAPAYVLFNNEVVQQKPATKTEKLFVFINEQKNETAKLSFYVCDDQKTVCEPHKHDLNLKDRAALKPSTQSSAPSEYFDIKNFNLVSADGRSTLLVFSAPWCPACIRLKTETLHKPEVLKQLSNLNLVKLNSDIADNYELSQKFKVRAIPTMILLDKNGQETYRWLDFQSAGAFAKDLQGELKKVSQAEALLMSAQMGDAKAASALAHRAYNTLDYAEAVKWFSLAKSAEDQNYKLASEVALAQEKTETDPKLFGEYLETLQKAISLTTSHLDQIRWSLDYYEKKKELNKFSEDAKLKAQVLVSKIDKLYKNKKMAIKEFAQSTYGNYAGFEKEELLWMKSRLFDVLDNTAEKKKANQEQIQQISKRQILISKPGEILNMIAYLKEAGDTKKVEELYKKLIQKYSNSYVYFEKYARYVKKNKNFEKALSLTNEALKYPQGNIPQLNLLKTQILKDMDKKSEALALIEETLKFENINHKRFAGTLKRLTEIKEELSK